MTKADEVIHALQQPCVGDHVRFTSFESGKWMRGIVEALWLPEFFNIRAEDGHVYQRYPGYDDYVIL